MDGTRDSLDRLTTVEAASRLGISEAGVRKRVQRGQIPHQRDETGRL
jgi:excisionase family DNA binding protein